MTLTELSGYYSTAILLSFASTGLKANHLPIEIALEIIRLPTGERVANYHSLVKVSKETWDSADPKEIFSNVVFRILKRTLI